MVRYFRSPEGRRLARVTATRRPPDGWVEITAEENEELRRTLRTAADARSTEFLREMRTPKVEAARALIQLGLTADQAAAVSGLTVDEIEPVP